MANRMRLDTLSGGMFLRQEAGVPEEAPRLPLVTRGEELARLLADAMACGFAREEPERLAEDGEELTLVKGFLRDCAEFSDVHGLSAELREEMGVYFGERLDALWRQDWLVFGGAHEAVLEPGPHPLRGRVVTLCVARVDSPSVWMDERLRHALDVFKVAMDRVQGRAGGEGSGGLLN